MADCKYITDEIDKFTGIKKLYTKSVPLVNKMLASVWASGVVLGDYKFLRLGILSGGIMSIDEDQELMLMMASDSIITLKNLEYVVSSVVGSAWSLTVRYVISNDQLDYLINNRVTEGRYYTNGGYVDFEVKEKNVNAFQHMLRCIQ